MIDVLQAVAIGLLALSVMTLLVTVRIERNRHRITRKIVTALLTNDQAELDQWRLAVMVVRHDREMDAGRG